MAARGTEAKSAITKKLLSTFNGSFVFGKEIRIPIEENGEIVQIKVTLTAAKDNVQVEAANDNGGQEVITNSIDPITDEEEKEILEFIKDNVAEL